MLTSDRSRLTRTSTPFPADYVPAFTTPARRFPDRIIGIRPVRRRRCEGQVWRYLSPGSGISDFRQQRLTRPMAKNPAKKAGSTNNATAVLINRYNGTLVKGDAPTDANRGSLECSPIRRPRLRVVFRISVFGFRVFAGLQLRGGDVRGDHSGGGFHHDRRVVSGGDQPEQEQRRRNQLRRRPRAAANFVDAFATDSAVTSMNLSTASPTWVLSFPTPVVSTSTIWTSTETIWFNVRGNVISADDPRYAWVPFLIRGAGSDRSHTESSPTRS